MTGMTLSERIIAAGPYDAEQLLEELWDASPAHWKSGVYTRYSRLLAFNTPETYLGAAMMLVPKGWSVLLSDATSPGWFAHIGTRADAPFGEASARAGAAWQALAAAIAKTSVAA